MDLSLSLGHLFFFRTFGFVGDRSRCDRLPQRSYEKNESTFELEVIFSGVI
jgi:hypothetical protein